MATEPEGYEDLSTIEQDAFALSRAAVALDQAKGNTNELVAALDHNLQLWSTIRVVVSDEANTLPVDIKDNLVKLSQYIAAKTFEYGSDIPEDVVDSLININLQISQGLLEGN
ncbi:MAG: hypothetical protein ISR52_07935 [Rhodospirillales bacterium]|nr:hypothetical protein [Rhodospirillales bacterium]